MKADKVDEKNNTSEGDKQVSGTIVNRDLIRKYCRIFFKRVTWKS